jgi:hypothetical protein
VDVYLDSIVDSNVRQKLKAVHKEPFEKGLGPLKGKDRNRFSLQPHTGMLPDQLEDKLRARLKVRDIERRRRQPEKRSVHQSSNSLVDSQEVSQEGRMIRLQELRKSKADRRLIADLLEEQPRGRPEYG